MIDLDDDDKSTIMEDEEPEDPELAKILEESRAAAAKKVEQERLLRTGSHQADEVSDIKIKIRVFWEPPPGAHAKWAFAFTYVCQLCSANTPPLTLSPDGTVSKAIRNHHTEDRGRDDGRYSSAL